MPIYMWYEGIDGTVKRKGKKWIPLESAQFGVGRHISSSVGSAREREAPIVTEIVVTKDQDDSSGPLFREVLKAHKGKKVVIEFVKLDKNGAEEAPYITIELEHTLISGYDSGGGWSGRPMESYSLNFTSMKYSDNAPGKVMGRKERAERSRWDLAEARGS